jgi:3-oxoacyl-[acyl-carrier protein] reductase
MGQPGTSPAIPQRFRAKVVFITGAGAGIGQHYAQRFAQEGASIAVTDLDLAAARRVADELTATGSGALALQMDVADANAVEAAVRSTVDHFGGIDVLVNNAGIHLGHAQLPFTVEAVAQWRQVLEVNVLGALTCAAACRPSMAARGGGVIINHSSMAAYAGGGAYGVSKLALNALTLGLATEFGADGIRVNGIAPGLVDSEAALEYMNDPIRAGLSDLLVAGQMIKRPGRMSDLADMALFLASDQASFVTGQTILVDGGHTKKPI